MSTASPQSPRGRRLDTAALTQPVDEPAITAFIADSKATGKPWQRMTTGLPRPSIGDIFSQLLPVVIPAAGILFFLVIGGSSLIEAVWRFTLTAPFPLNLVIVGVVALIVAGILVQAAQAVKMIRSLIIPRWWWVAAYRLTRFAAVNGLRYGHDELANYPGVIFGTGVERTVERRLSSAAGRPVEIGNYRYTISAESRENSTVYGWGYVAITLDRRLPHLLLDAKANNKSVFGIKSSNLPADLAKDQRLSLGGEFDAKFTLYAPSDYGRDAFYIFSPDLMALFIDRVGTFDVEIIDDKIFLCGARFDLLDPRTYDWLLEVVDTVVARTVRRTQRYSDDFALLESDPALLKTDPEQRQPAADAVAAVEDSTPPRSGNALPPGLGLGLGLGGVPRPASSTGPAGTQNESVFTFGGDGPPKTASNTIAEKGRRLRQRRWTVGTVVAVAVLGYWLYSEIVAPIFGLPGGG